MELHLGIDSALVLDDGADNATNVGANVGQVSGANGVVDLGERFRDNPEIGVTFSINSLDFATTDEEYTLNVEFSTDVGFSDIVATRSKVLDPSAEAGKQSHTIVTEAAAQFVRSNYTLAGTTPILDPEKVFMSNINN